RSLRWQSAARIAAARQPLAAFWRNLHRRWVVTLRRRIRSAIQTLKVRPQPGRRLRLLQKIRRTERFSLGTGVVEAEERAVPNQAADRVAVRTGRLLEAFGDGIPFLVGPVKPPLLAHVRPPPLGKSLILPRGDVRGRGEVR